MYGQDRALGLGWCVCASAIPGVIVGYVMYYIIAISQALSTVAGAAIAIPSAIATYVVLMRIMRKWDEDMGR